MTLDAHPERSAVYARLRERCTVSDRLSELDDLFTRALLLNRYDSTLGRARREKRIQQAYVEARGELYAELRKRVPARES